MKNGAIYWPTTSFLAYPSKLLPTLIVTISMLAQKLVGEHFSKTHLPKQIIFNYFVENWFKIIECCFLF